MAYRKLIATVLISMLAISACSGSRPSPPKSSNTPIAASIKALQYEYEADTVPVTAAQYEWAQAVARLSNPTPSQVARAAVPYDNALRKFDSQMLQLPLSPRGKADVFDMVAADTSLLLDLTLGSRNVSSAQWISTLRRDVARHNQALATLRKYLQLPPPAG
jgi:hypothetical protein